MEEEVTTQNKIAGCGCLIILVLAGVGCLLGPHVGGLILLAGSIVFGIIYAFATVLTNPDKEKRHNAGCVCFSVLGIAVLVSVFFFPAALIVIGIIVGVFLLALWIAKGKFDNQAAEDKKITDKFEAALLASGADFGIENEIDVNVTVETQSSTRKRLTVDESTDQLVEEVSGHKFTKFNRFISNYETGKPKAQKIFAELSVRAEGGDSDSMFMLALLFMKLGQGEESGKWLNAALDSNHAGAREFLDSLKTRLSASDMSPDMQETVRVILQKIS